MEGRRQSFGKAQSSLGAMLRGLSSQSASPAGGRAVLVGLTLWVFVALLGQPKYVTLYSGLRAGRGARPGRPPGRQEYSAIRFRPTAAACWCRRTSSMPAAWRPPPPACRATRAWVLSCSTLPTGRAPISPKRSTTSGRSKASWSAPCRRSAKWRRCGCIW